MKWLMIATVLISRDLPSSAAAVSAPIVQKTVMPPPVEAASEPAATPQLTASWAYGIDFTIPWVLRKVFGMETLQLATVERLDTPERVLENTMVNVSEVMGVRISEWTHMAPNRDTGGCTWTRRLNVEYPEWLSEWAVKKIKKAYTDESVGARAKDERLFARTDCEISMLSVPDTAAFCRELGMATASGLLYA